MGNLARLRLLAQRAAVIGSVSGAAYFLVASILFPYWSYDFIWHQGFLYAENGWMALLGEVKDHPVTTATILMLLFATALVVNRFRRTIFAVIDRNWGWVVCGATLTLVVTSFCVYGINKNRYDQEDRALEADESVLKTVEAFLAPNQRLVIAAPIDFVYLDTANVETLFNEIQPELVERQRVEGTTSNIEGKSGIDAGHLTVSLAAKKESESKATLERVEFSPQRKCIEVMTFSRDAKRAIFLSDFHDWLSNRTLESLEKARNAPLNADSLKPIAKLGSPEEIEEEAAINHSLQKELSALEGLIFVKGKFTRDSVSKDQIFLKFSNKPSIVIRVFIAPTSGEPLIGALPLNATLTVFGRVTKPLSDDGVVQVRALAIF